MECVGAIDQGTQSTRFILYDKRGIQFVYHQKDLTQHRPRSGWTEHDPMEILATVRECIDTAMASAREKVGEVRVVGLGITNQRETTVAWDRETGKPLHNAIVWHDMRTQHLVDRMTQKLGSSDYFRSVTGLPISTYFSAYKLKWMLEHVPPVQEAAKAGRLMAGTVDSWLIYNLTGGVEGGVFVTDVTNASRTNFMDIRSRQWHEETLQMFGVARGMLPEIRSNAEVYGTVSDGILKGVPISGCLGDQQAAMLGQRCGPHEVKNTYGTGCFLLLNTGHNVVTSQKGLLTTVSYQLGPHEQPHYALEGAIATAGSSVSWLRDNLGIIASPAETEELASSVPSSCGVYFVPAFSGLLAPHWRDDARGALLGLTGYSSRAHIVRAVLEAMCWQTRDVMEVMKEEAGLEALKLLRVDGGATHNSFLMQLQADALSLDVRRPAHMETTSLGAAFAAGIGAGFWTAEWVLDESNFGQHGSPTTFHPQMTPAEADKRYGKWKIAVQRSFGLDVLDDDYGDDDADEDATDNGNGPS